MTKKRFFHKDEYAEIPFFNKPGTFFKVDAQYADVFRKYEWRANENKNGNIYVTERSGMGWKKIHPLTFSERTKYKNGDSLDLRSSNIEEQKKSKTKYNYVYRYGGNINVNIGINGERFKKTSGFKSEEEAAIYADKIIIENGGRLDKINFEDSIEKFSKNIEDEKPETFTLATKIDDEYYYIEGFSSEKDVENAKQVIGEMLRNSEKEVVKYVEVVKPSLMKRWFGKAVQE